MEQYNQQQIYQQLKKLRNNNRLPDWPLQSNIYKVTW